MTLVPLVWLRAVAMTASCRKIWSPYSRLEFLADGQLLSGQLAAGAN